ncbi:hypothetical protein [Burkholderia gladioli]|uniref:hypothetical protein n=1 Tax=Burkholderia gladioli TaxID=28095 RepID=UPI000F525B6A|nr:hypothetical protein [Burkholderia gladioli]
MKTTHSERFEALAARARAASSEPVRRLFACLANVEAGFNNKYWCAEAATAASEIITGNYAGY